MLKITGAQALDARKALKLTQGEVAKETGIARAYISQFENGIKQLTRTEVITLKDYFIDKGFVFDSVTDSKSEAVAAVQQETDTLQSEISSLEMKGQQIAIQAVELGDLVDSINGLASLVKVTTEPKANPDNKELALAAIDPEAYENISKKFDEAEKALFDFFTQDQDGDLEKPSFFDGYEDRTNKVIGLMALQYLRLRAMNDDEIFVNVIPEIEVDDMGSSAVDINQALNGFLSAKTNVDRVLGKKAA